MLRAFSWVRAMTGTCTGTPVCSCLRESQKGLCASVRVCACAGASTALLGRRSAMACTVAVETAITEHYDKQLRLLHQPQHKGESTLRHVRLGPGFVS